jgi:hypothetical protein
MKAPKHFVDREAGTWVMAVRDPHDIFVLCFITMNWLTPAQPIGIGIGIGIEEWERQAQGIE